MSPDAIQWDQPDGSEVARIAAHLAFHVATQNERDKLRERSHVTRAELEQGSIESGRGNASVLDRVG